MLVAGRLTVIDARTTPRGPVNPELANDKLAEDVTPDASLNVVAVPMAVPAALRNATLPSQEAAVPADEAKARLVKLMRAVSVVPRPNGASAVVLVVAAVVVVVTCPIAETAPAMTIRVIY